MQIATNDYVNVSEFCSLRYQSKYNRDRKRGLNLGDLLAAVYLRNACSRENCAQQRGTDRDHRFNIVFMVVVVRGSER